MNDVKSLDIEEVAKAIEADVGEPLPELREALAEGKAEKGRVTGPEQILVRSARRATGLTQAEFVDRISTPVATLRDWEQGNFTPPGSALCLMRIIMQHPELAQELAAA